MTSIGPVLWWTLFGYFLFQGSVWLAVDLARGATNTRNGKPSAVITVLIAFGFAVWLAVARWVAT